MPRTCKNCLATKSDENFARRSYLCRPCAQQRKKARVQAWRAANKEHRRAYDQAYADVHRPHILARKKRYHAEHHAKEDTYNRAYRLAHRDRLRAKMRNWHEQNRESQLRYKRQYYRDHQQEILQKKSVYDVTNAEAIRQRGRDWYIKNRYRLQAANRARVRKYYAEHREHCLRYTKTWRKKNPDKYRASMKKRAALKRGAGIAVIIRHDVIAERDQWICHICHKKVTRETWSLDHLIPLSKGGRHSPENVSLAHRLCNARRGVGNMIPAQLRLFG